MDVILFVLAVSVLIAVSALRVSPQDSLDEQAYDISKMNLK